jgi:hypothetical protein
VYQASTQLLSGAGATERPQIGQDITAVAGSGLDMAVTGATTVPRRQRPIAGKFIMPDGAGAENPRGPGNIPAAAGGRHPAASRSVAAPVPASSLLVQRLKY